MSAIGIDVGGTSIKLGVVNDGMEVVYRDQRATPRAAEEMVLTALRMADAAWRQYPGAPLGVSCAGTLDGRGHITANQLGWVDEPLKKMINALFNRDIPLENDAVCALIAEHRYGALKGAGTGILLTLGTGIGGGLIIGGQPIRGFQGLHGEIGHMMTHADGLACGCGQKGCWEQYAAARALQHMAGDISVQEVINHVRAGRMMDVWQNYIREVVFGVSSLMMIFMPEIIAFGGGLSNAGDIVVDAIRQAAQETSAYRAYCPFTRIVSARFQNDAGILGAAALTGFGAAPPA